MSNETYAKIILSGYLFFMFGFGLSVSDKLPSCSTEPIGYGPITSLMIMLVISAALGYLARGKTNEQ